MSFDLGVLDLDRTPTLDEVVVRYERICEGVDDGPLSVRITAFVSECESRWPGESDDEFEASPWATWPLITQRTSAAFVANMRWDRAEDMLSAWTEMAERHGLVLFNPQSDTVSLPTRLGEGRRRRFFSRNRTK